MTYYAENRRTVYRIGKPVFVPLDQLPACQGFQSVYAFDEALMRVLQSKGNTTDLRDCIVYSDMLFVDFDVVNPVIDDFFDWLYNNNYTYEMWDSGNRGPHAHVPIEPMRGTTVPQAQLAWVREHIPTGLFDPTIYRHHSVIRLPGTWHEKRAGHRKHLLESHHGRTLVISTIDVPLPGIIPTESATTNERDPAMFWSAVMTPKLSPGRNARLYSLGRLAAECGIVYEKALEAGLYWAREECKPPMTHEYEIQREFTNGYRDGAGRSRWQS